MTTPTENGALGGIGSISDILKSVALNGLSRSIDGYNSKKYPLTYFNETQTINAAGEVKPSAAPAKTPSIGESAAQIFANPLIVGIGIAIIGSVALFMVLRK